MSDTRVRIVLASTNETGMGHLARLSAIGLALPPTAEPIIFSASPAIHRMTSHGLRAEYCAGHQRSRMSRRSWDTYLGERLGALLDETQAKVLVVDGEAPSPGLLSTRRAHPAVAFAWVRRGARRGTTRAALAARPYFDAVIVPDDFGAISDLASAHLEQATRVPPISGLEHLAPLERDEAASALGLDSDRPAALVALPAGTTGESVAAVLAATSVFLSTPEWQVALTCPPQVRSGLAVDQLARIRQLDEVYPLARYLTAFDAAVCAPSYNAVHELLPAGVPTVFVPPLASAEREARARNLTMHGVALCSETDNAHAVARSVRRLLDPEVRASLRIACADLEVPRGASATADVLTRLAKTFVRHEPPRTGRDRTVGIDWRAAAIRALRPVGTTAVRRAFGQVPRPRAGTGELWSEAASGRTTPRRGLPGRRPPVRGLAGQPIVTSRLDPELLAGDQPVEHVLPESSPEYRRRRIAIAREFYRANAVSSRLVPLQR